MASAVIVQTTVVSMKVPSMAMTPCCTGLFVCAAAWAMPQSLSPIRSRTRRSRRPRETARPRRKRLRNRTSNSANPLHLPPIHYETGERIGIQFTGRRPPPYRP